MGAIVDDKTLEAMAESWHSQGLRVVLTNGCFDLLHRGHLRTFCAAKEYGDLLVVGVNSDRSIRALKGDRRPIVSETDRSELLAALAPVDFVTVFDEDDACRLIRRVRPHVYVKGGDYSMDRLPEREALLEVGAEPRFIPLVYGISTSEIIRRVCRAYAGENCGEPSL